MQRPGELRIDAAPYTTPNLIEPPVLICDQGVIATAALFFHESLDLAVVLNRVAQRIASLCGGVCQVRLNATPAYAASATTAMPNGSGAPPAPGRAETYSTLLNRLDAPHPDASGPRIGANGDAHAQAGDAALLITPLIARGKRLGTIDLVLPVALDADLSDRQQLLYALAAHAALAIDTAITAAQAQARDQTTASLDQALAPLLAMLTHDLRSPLTAVDTSVQLLDRALQNAQAIDRNGMARLTALAKAGIGQLKAQIEALSRPAAAPPLASASTPIDLVAVIRSLAHFYQQTTSRHQIIVVNEVAQLHGAWQQLHIERMVGNLLDNGIKYSPNGGTIRITVDCREHAGARWANLSIADSGIGIPQGDLAQIAEHGYRARNVGALPGTGFGLANVRELVEQYAGTLTIASPPDGATTVQIRLPLTEGSP